MSLDRMHAKLRALPREVHALAFTGTGAWIVGSAADPDVLTSPRDYDVVVPWSEWAACAMQLPHLGEVVRLTRFGGLCIRTREGVLVDVWPADLGAFFLNPPAKYAWHPKNGTLLKRVAD